MRLDSTEVNPRRDRGRVAPRHAEGRRSALRRSAIEALERRTLMATLPSPTITGQVDVTNATGAEYNPHVAVSPTNPLDLVMTFQGIVAPPQSGTAPFDYAGAKFSTDGGTTWTAIQLPGNLADPTTSNPTLPFRQIAATAVGFDADNNFYVMVDQISGGATATIAPTGITGAAGAIVVTKYSLGGAGATRIVSTPAYKWYLDGAATDPTLAVDSNLATFGDVDSTGVTRTQVDPSAGNVYLAFSANSTGPAGSTNGVNFRPSSIQMLVSSDGGQTFSTSSSFTSQNADPASSIQGSFGQPTLAISQGTADGRVTGGQVTAAWTDTGTLAGANPPSTLLQTNSLDNPTTDVFTDATVTPINDALAGTPSVPQVTNIPLTVNITDTRFKALSNLTATLNLVHPSVDQISAVLIPPTGSGLQPVTLFRNMTNSAGVMNKNVGISGANLGVLTSNGQALGTTFDDTAYRGIVDIDPNTGNRGAAAPYVGRYRPEESTGARLSDYDGATAAQLNGTWTLQIVDNVSGGAPAFLENWSLNLSSGNAATGQVVTAAVPLRNIANAGGASGEAIQTSPVLASDNTLGAFSPYQGRLYLAFVDHVNPTANPQDPADDGNIMLETSDNGGLSWSLPVQVNDDDSLVDGFSESDPVGLNPITGRAQFQPSLAVDQTTGTLAVSWLDTRYDASRARTVDMVTTSIDGGATFSKDVYANESQTATDAATGKAVVQGPIPDNFTTAANLNITLSTGETQGLAFESGRLYPMWSSNQNAVNSGAPDSLVDIRIAPSLTAAGPRVVSSTMGPVGGSPDPDDPYPVNLARAADGTPIANAFVVTFDRPVDPSTFTTQDAQVFFRDTTPGNATGRSLPVIAVKPLDLGAFGPGGAVGAENFEVDFQPSSAVGTYTYTVGPGISDRIRTDVQKFTAAGSPITQAATGVPLNLPDVTTTDSPLTISGVPAGEVALNVSVNFTIDHTFDTDLAITLISPSGQRILLVNHAGDGARDVGNTNFVNTTLTDSATTSIASAIAPFTGSFLPAQPLSGFNGTAINGTWTLEVADTVRVDSGTLVNWSLTLTPATLSSALTSGNAMDQDANSLDGEAPTAGPISKNDVYASPSPLNGVLLNTLDPTGKTYQVVGPYDQDTLPLIVAGPVVASATAQNTSTQSAADDLVLNKTSSYVDVTFDRDMNPATITPASVLRITGPQGSVLADRGFASTTTPSVIPPAPAGGYGVALNSPITVQDDGSFVVGHLAVQLNITSSSDLGLTLVLVGPDGTQAVLVSGGSGSNFTDTIFDDNAATPVTSGAGPFASAYRPVQPLSAFVGKTLAGRWTLVAVDGLTGATATLNNWSLVATPQATISQPIAGNNRTFRVSFPTQQLSGTYTVQLASSAQDVNGNALDTNQNAGVAELEGTAPAGQSAPVTYPATNSVPKGIAAKKTIDSTLTVGGGFVIQDVAVTLNITYPNDPDLTATLIAPNGDRIILFSGVGSAGTRANFNNTLLKDSATTLIQNAGAPFFSTAGYKPQQSLGQALDGRLAAGTYTLEITNAGTSTGTLNSWSLTLYRPLSTSGLGEAVADQASASFRIFNSDPTDPIAIDAWTPVGPAPIIASADNPIGGSGQVGGLAVDPSDPSGNTVYVGGASGGIWKTTNFLSPNGPTYVPLTNNGPTLGQNIGGIAVFGRNNDPNQSIIVAGTGFGDATVGTATTDVSESSNGSDSTGKGTGFLLSTNGGATWSLLDSTDNTLPYAQRDHIFASNGGTTTFKVAVDPKVNPATGGVIIYAALSGVNGGIWRSLDTGMHWTKMLAGNATDLVLDPGSGTGVLGGNLQTLYAGIRGVGVFISPNEGQTFNLMAGGQGNALLINTTTGNPVPIGAPPSTPNGNLGRIVLAKPALTGIASEDLFYSGWLYAAVVLPNNHVQGLYQTKDFGANWTLLKVSTLPVINNLVRAIPTNDSTQPNYDVGGGGNANSGLAAQGNYDISLAVDPTNPNVVYLGGTNAFQPTGLIRVDATNAYDAHNVSAYTGGGPGGAALQINSTGSATVNNNQNAPPIPILNYYRDPNAPFVADATLFTTNTASLTNTGAGVTWTPFDLGLNVTGPEINGTFAQQLATAEPTITGNIHRIITLVDPLTGHSRLIIGGDVGVYSMVDNGGVYDSGIGTATFGAVDKNGNLQLTQVNYGAVQASTASANVAGNLFVSGTYSTGFATSDPGILSNGDLGYTNVGADTGGVGVDSQSPTTDSAFAGSNYVFFWPCCGGARTDFFQVGQTGSALTGRTSGLLQASNPGPTPDPQWPSSGFGANFAVNPLNGQQVIISSIAGRVFRTENQGLQWQVIGNPGDLDGSYVQAPAFGAPDAASTAGVGNLDNFLYAGTFGATTAAGYQGGRIYVTQTSGGSAGGNGWTNITNGDLLADETADPTPIQQIITDPTPGSHDAYAVTANGVYYNINTVSDPGQAGASTWVRITGNLFTLTHAIFDDPNSTQAAVLSLDTIAADWRYAIPNAGGGTHPVLYVGGQGGVFRSLDNGATWAPYPSSTPAPQGTTSTAGSVPVVDVTSLTISAGNIDPTTGRPLPVAGDPDVLVASTFGRGNFAIRLAPVVLDGSLALDPNRPAPGGSDSGISNTDLVTNVLRPVIDGTSEISAFGTQVTVNLYDLTPTTPGGPLQAPSAANFLGTTTTDAAGNFQVQVPAGHFLPNGLTDGVKTLGVQAVDQSLAAGNVATITFTLSTVPPVAPLIQLDPTLPAPGGSDTGISPTDGITDVNTPYILLTGVPATGIFSLYRDNKLVAQVVVGASGTPTGGSISIQDPGDPAAGGGFTPVPDGTHIYKAQITDLAGNVGPFSGNLPVTISTKTPATPAPPTLDPLDDSGAKGDNITNVNRPRFDGSGVPGGLIFLIDSSGAIVGRATVAANGTYGVSGGDPLQPAAALPDGTYTFRVQSEDVAGNLSALSAPITVTILTAIPTRPTLALVAADNSGPPGQNVTNVTQPRLVGTGPAGLDVELIDEKGNIAGLGAVITPVGSQPPVVVNVGGTFQLQFPSPLADGTYVVVARVFDAAGNSSDSAPLVLTIQTKAPSITTNLILNPANVYGVASPGSAVRTTARRPVFGVSAASASGAPAAGTTIDLIDQATGAIIASAVTNSAGVALETPAGDLPDGSITLIARAVDVAGNLSTPSPSLSLRVITAAGDYFGDGVGDLSLFRRTTGQFLVTEASGARSAFLPSFGGQPGDIPVQGDFDGDGKTDTAFYRPSTGTWYINRTLLGPETIQFGQPNVDIPVAADYDGDGKADIAVYRPTTGQWLILQSQAGPRIVTMGGPAGFIPVPADYDGDGKADIALYLPSTGQWFVQRSAAGPEVVTFGIPNVDQPVPADYDGDGEADLAIFRPTTGQWIVIGSASGAKSATLGSPGDVPVPLDFDGDGKADIAVYRPGTGQWFLQQSKAGARVIGFGNPATDQAVPAAPADNLGGLSTLSTRSFVSAEAIQPPATGSTLSTTTAAGGLDLGASASRFSSASSAIPPVTSAPPGVVPVAGPSAVPSPPASAKSRAAARAEARAEARAAAAARAAALAERKAEARRAHAHDLAMAELLGRGRR